VILLVVDYEYHAAYKDYGGGYDYYGGYEQHADYGPYGHAVPTRGRGGMHRGTVCDSRH